MLNEPVSGNPNFVLNHAPGVQEQTFPRMDFLIIFLVCFFLENISSTYPKEE